MVAVNYLAPWVLTNTLRGKLVASAPARVVTVASEGARWAGRIDPVPDLTATAEYTRREAMTLYFRSKLMDIMFTQELGRRLAGTVCRRTAVIPVSTSAASAGTYRSPEYSNAFCTHCGSATRAAAQESSCDLPPTPPSPKPPVATSPSRTPHRSPAQNPDVVGEFRPNCGRPRPHCSTEFCPQPDDRTPDSDDPNQPEREAFAAAKVSRAMRLAVIAAVRAGSAVLAVANAPS